MSELLNDKKYKYLKKLFDLLSDDDKKKNNVDSVDDLYNFVRERMKEFRGALSFVGAVNYTALEINEDVWAELMKYKINSDGDVVLTEKQSELIELSDIGNIKFKTVVSIMGFVDAIKPVVEFTRTTNDKSSNGRRSVLSLIDGNGNKTMVTLWDKVCDEVPKIASCLVNGEQILIENVIYKETKVYDKVYTGFHTTNDTVIKYNAGMKRKNLRKNKLILDFSGDNIGKYLEKSIDVMGHIKQFYPEKQFTRRDGSHGFLRTIILEDEKFNTVPVKLWSIPLSFDLQNMKVYISNIYVLKDRFNELVLSSRSFTYLHPIERKETKVLLKDVNKCNNNEIISVEGIISKKAELKEFKRKDGSNGKVLRVILKDGDTLVYLVLWDGFASEFRYDLGDKISVSSVRCKKNSMGNIELNTNRYSVIKKYDDE